MSSAPASKTPPSSQGPRALHGGALLARMLRKQGIDRIFSLNGGHISLIYDACIDEGIRIIDVRHEEAAGHMAHAFARTTGKIAVAVVSAGPGVTNIVTAVANAFEGGCPMLVIGGKAPLRQFELGALQDIPQAEIMAPITKLSKTVFEASRIPEYVATAIRTAVSCRSDPKTNAMKPACGGATRRGTITRPGM